MFAGKTELHRNIPINLKFKNEFRKELFLKKFRYNYYLDYKVLENYEDEIPMYSYY